MIYLKDRKDKKAKEENEEERGRDNEVRDKGKEAAKEVAVGRME
jgi:hypothetical protein